jgi:NhaP-type Na+/H+ or K+/H+ antiporter
MLVPVLLLVIRPLSVAVALAGTSLTPGDRRFVAWFGVRGVGSLYYVAVAIGFGVLPKGEEAILFWTTAACVVVSVVAHGVTASPLSRRWLPAGQGAPEP